MALPLRLKGSSTSHGGRRNKARRLLGRAGFIPGVPITRKQECSMACIMIATLPRHMIPGKLQWMQSIPRRMEQQPLQPLRLRASRCTFLRLSGMLFAPTFVSAKMTWPRLSAILRSRKTSSPGEKGLS